MTIIERLPRIMAIDFTYEFGRYLIAALLFTAIIWGLKRTRLKSRQIQSRAASRADMKRELFASFKASLVYLLVTIIVVVGVEIGVLQHINHSLGLGSDAAILGGMILAHDTYFYWTHRAMHHPRLFKAVHRVHHRSITPTPFTAYSFAAPEAFVAGMFVPLWQLFVATPGGVLFIFLNFQIIRNVMGHAGLELMPRWWLKTPLTSWLNTTTHHDLHHAGSFNHNFGLYFTWWDRLMGTEHPHYHATFERVVAPSPALSPAPASFAHGESSRQSWAARGSR